MIQPEQTEVENIQFSLFVTNEKTAISWLYQQLSDEFGGPRSTLNCTVHAGSQVG